MKTCKRLWAVWAYAAKRKMIGGQILQRDQGKIKFLMDVGLDYLTLARLPEHYRRRSAENPSCDTDWFGLVG